MAGEFDAKIFFESSVLAPDAFRVVELDGTEHISRTYRFDLRLVAEDPEIDLREVLNEPASLSLERDGERRTIHGVLAEFEQLGWSPGHNLYRAVLVPRLWLLSLRRQNQVFAQDPGALTGWSSGLKLEQIFEEILKGAGFAKDDYEISLQEPHPYREFVVQYQETDLDFISRLMEHEGIFSYFEHGEDKEKLIIADKSERFEPIEGHPEMIFRPPTGMVAVEREAVHALTCKESRVPREVMLREYNWRTPSLNLTVTETVDDSADGLVCDYGNHYKDCDNEGATLARFRAEELRCGQTLFSGAGNGIAFHAGFLFDLVEHPRPDFDQEYLIVSVHHQGSQTTSGVSNAAGQDPMPAYRNEFTCIPASLPFRPARVTPKPKIYGTITAKVDATPGTRFAEMDDYGRYRVALMLDQGVDVSSLPGGTRSRWVRMAQPYAGQDIGMHFPLHPGTEVLLTHLDGDPDRPVIIGTVPNTETRAPVDSENRMKNVIRSGGSNWLELDDAPGQEGFLMTNKKMGAIRVMRTRPRGTKG
ncbi:MAG: type VI secretion system Vgr family protein [Planctomycetota bacterium]|jgi:type VI secretion system secreted protein VgrG